MLPRKFETPFPSWDWANAGVQTSTCPEHTSIAATAMVAVRLVIALAVQRMWCPPVNIPFQKALSRFPMA
jgi:hypothetical protein